MKRYLPGIIFTFVFLCCGSHKNIYNCKIYEQIYNCQGININYLNQNKEQPHHVRIQLDNVNKLIQWDYLNILGHSKKSDTVYILEKDGIQGDFNFTVWNKNDTLSYTNENGKLRQTNEHLFTKYMMALVTEWNIDEIKKEEKINKVTLPEETVYATKITFNNGEYGIECVSFSDFYNLNRDSITY